MGHPKDGFIYVWLFLQSTQKFYHGLDKKKYDRLAYGFKLGRITLPLRPGRLGET